MNERDDIRQELEDRLTDQALIELLGGREPPDLTARILAAAKAHKPRQARVRLALAASLLLALGLCVAYQVNRGKRTTLEMRAPDMRIAKDTRNEPTTQKAAVGTTEQPPSTHEQLASLVDEFNKLMHEHRYDEAGKVFERAAKLAPDELIVKQMKNMVRMVSKMENWKTLSENAALGSADYETSATKNDPLAFGEVKEWKRLTKSRKVPSLADLAVRIPDSSLDEPPIFYPDPELWRMLTERRKKYKAVDLAEPGGHETEIRAALDETTEGDFTDQPLTDVLDYLKQRHDIEIQIDDRALSDSSVSTETPITHRFKGLTLRSALRRVLGDLDLTYVIRNDVLVVTTKASAEDLLGGNLVRNRLRTLVSLNYKATPLKQVVDDLSKLTKVPIRVDAESLKKQRIATDSPVSIELHSEISAASALCLVLEPLHLAFEVRGAELRVRSEEDCITSLAEPENHDRYARIIENPFLGTIENPLSTFGVDVDTASYAKVRRYLMQAGELPPPDAVRIEELINYFDYDYPPPEGNAPFAAQMDVAACPWQPQHRLLRIGLKGRELPEEQRPAANLVFLIDVSGSMEPDDRLPRVRRAMRLLADRLRENDRVAIVTYAAQTGIALPSTTGFQKDLISSALDALRAGGSTNGGAGIRLAYDMAQEHFVKNGTNRVILCTDGDFNVGTTSTGELERLIEQKAKDGVFLTVLGFGMGNHNDELMEKLADKGNGNYGYIDSEEEARKLLVEQAGGTLVTIAKDVKVQLEFNPRLVAAYRLIGYENRLLQAEDFSDDKKDAGDIGAGHAVTALYEIIPATQQEAIAPVGHLKYQRPAELTDAASSDEILTLKLRYKKPSNDVSERAATFPLRDTARGFGEASADFRFAAAVAGFGLMLRDSEFKGDLTYDAVLELAQQAIGNDRYGRRTELVNIVRLAKAITASAEQLGDEKH